MRIFVNDEAHFLEIWLTKKEDEDRYISCLVYDRGEIVKTERICSTGNNRILDLFAITVRENGAEKNIKLYLDGYGKQDTKLAPHGFHLKGW